MRIHKLNTIVWLLTMLVLSSSLTAQTPLTEVGFGTLVAESGFADFNKALDKDGWGMQVLLNGLKQNLPYLAITQSRNARYFAMAKVTLAEKWELALKQPKKDNISLVKLHLRLFLFDVTEQREIARETVTTYSGVGKLVGVSGNITLLKRAFEDALALATHKIAQRLPLLGTIRKIDGNEIIVDLGGNCGINKFSVLEVLGKDGESLGRFKVVRVMPGECKAAAEGENNAALSVGLPVRLLLLNPMAAQEDRPTVLGTVRKMKGNEIITDLGASRGVNNASVLEVVGDNGEIAGRFRVTLTTPGECKAVLESGNSAALRVGLVVRLVQTNVMQTQEETYLSANFGKSQIVILRKKTPVPLTLHRDDLGMSEDEDDDDTPIQPIARPKDPPKPQPKPTTPADMSVDDNGKSTDTGVGNRYVVNFAYFNDKNKLERAYQAIRSLESKNVLKIADVKQPNARNLVLQLVYRKSQRELWDELKKLFQWETINLNCQLKDSEIVVTEK